MRRSIELQLGATECGLSRRGGIYSTTYATFCLPLLLAISPHNSDILRASLSTLSSVLSQGVPLSLPSCLHPSLALCKALDEPFLVTGRPKIEMKSERRELNWSRVSRVSFSSSLFSLDPKVNFSGNATAKKKLWNVKKRKNKKGRAKKKTVRDWTRGRSTDARRTMRHILH